MPDIRRLALVPLVLLIAACSASVPSASPSAPATGQPSVSPSSVPPTQPPASSPPSAPPSSAPSPSPAPSPAPPSPSPSASPGIAHKTGHGDLIVRISIAGGFINPSTQLIALPEIAIYGDGTVLSLDTSGSQPTTPAVPPMLATTISEAGLQAILAAASDAGLLGKNGHYQGGIRPESSTTTFTVIAAGHTHTISVTALETQGGDPSTQGLRDKLAAFEAALGDIPAIVGASNVTTPQAPFQPTALEVFVTTNQSGAPDQTLTWPLSTPLATFGQELANSGSGGGINSPPLRCGIVTGTDLAALQPLIANATPETAWNSDGSLYTLSFRPELPDEAACPGM